MDTPPKSIENVLNVKKVGHITPSSNTVLEPLTTMMGYPIADRLSNHFTRIVVKKISLDSQDTGRFEVEKMVEAAKLLADANVDAILWNGTSGCWNGTEADLEICRRITEETSVPASTSTLAQYEVFKRYGAKKFALAVPYLDDVTHKTIETYGKAGYETVNFANLNITVNQEFAKVPMDSIRQLIRDADSAEAECVVVICTNLAAALVVEEMEQELGKPILDSVAVTFWRALEMVGLEASISGWGKLLAAGTVQSRLA